MNSIALSGWGYLFRLSLFSPSLILGFCYSVSAQFGELDKTFRPETWAPGRIKTALVQKDGKIIVAGDFTKFDGIPRQFVCRLNPGGTVDTGFIPPQLLDDGEPKVLISSLAQQHDGKVLVCGSFTTVAEKKQKGIVRLNTDGSFDRSFDPGSGLDGTYRLPYSIVIQPDGKVLVGGAFQSINRKSAPRIARLNSDGSVDTEFDPGTGFGFPGDALAGIVSCIALQSDGKVLTGGYFDAVNGIIRPSIARLNADGSLDASFDPGAGVSNGRLGPFRMLTLIYGIVPLSDGKVLIGGLFTSYDGAKRHGIVRVHSNGSLDTGFETDFIPPSTVFHFAVQSDGKMLISGRFGIMRLNADGTRNTPEPVGIESWDYFWSSSVETLVELPDRRILAGGSLRLKGIGFSGMALFNPDLSIETRSTFSDPSRGASYPGVVDAIVSLSDGKTLIGGTFTRINDVQCRGIARLLANGSVDSTFNTEEGPDGPVTSISLLSDGKIAIAGDFTKVGPLETDMVGRLHGNGRVDRSFQPRVTRRYVSGENPIVKAQTDGKLLISGAFQSVDNVARNGLARLNADGSLDNSFEATPLRASDGLYNFVIQDDGKILAANSSGGIMIWTGGDSPPTIDSQVTDPNRKGVFRLNSDGSLDTSFTASVEGYVRALALDANGRTVVGGEFSSINGLTRKNIARLNADGSIDRSFDPGSGPDVPVQSVAVRDDGKIVIAGAFNYFIIDGAYVDRDKVAVLNSDGTLDRTFVADLKFNALNYYRPIAVSIQSDGGILVGGSFLGINGSPRFGIARLLSGNSGPAIMLSLPTRERSAFSVSVSTVAGRSYRIEYNDSLGTNQWIPLQTVNGDGSVKRLTDSSATASRRFYRAVQLP